MFNNNNNNGLKRLNMTPYTVINMDDKKLLHDDDIVREDEGLVFNPYNPLNVEITLNDVQSILKEYDVPPLL